MKQPDWFGKDQKLICYMIDGSEEKSERGDYFLFLIFNPDHILHKVKLPVIPKKWYRKIDTFLKEGDDFCDDDEEILLNPQDEYLVNPRSCVVLMGL